MARSWLWISWPFEPLPARTPSCFKAKGRPVKLADISVPLVPLAPTSSRTSGQRAANSSVLVVAGSLAITRSKPSTTTTTKNYDTGARFFTFEPSSNSLLAFFVLKSVHRTWLKLMRENIKNISKSAALFNLYNFSSPSWWLQMKIKLEGCWSVNWHTQIYMVKGSILKILMKLVVSSLSLSRLWETP